MTRLSEIRAYVEKATEGPWKVVKSESDWYGKPDEEWCVSFSEDGDSTVLSEVDAAFIAQARTDLPLLLDIAEAAQALGDNYGVYRNPDSPDTAVPSPETFLALRAALARLEEQR